jgi:prepilin-type N-terminal cleavage/methylation domain-containing protein
MDILIRNQRGISLVELLVTLAILSLVGTIIWGVFFQGSSYSQKAATKNKLQQEANILITRMTKIHQTSDHYMLTSSDCETTVTYPDSDPPIPSVTFSNSQICFSVEIVNPSTNIPITNPVYPNTQDSKLIGDIHDKNDPTDKVDIDLLLYRLKGGGS